MERIRELRTDRGLSQAKLAVMADMDPATLNRLEQGKGNPNLRTLERVADALEVEVVELLGKAERRSSPELSLFNGLNEKRHTDETTREHQHLRDHVKKCLDRWQKVARGEDPAPRINYTYSIEVWSQTASLTKWFGELLPEATTHEQREIASWMDELHDAATKINAIADAAEGITPEAIEEEVQALIDAEVAAMRSNRDPDDQLADKRRRLAEARYAEQAAKTAYQWANTVKRSAAGE